MLRGDCVLRKDHKPLGQYATVFASEIFHNPLELVPQSNTLYDIVIELDNKLLYILTNQTIFLKKVICWISKPAPATSSRNSGITM